MILTRDHFAAYTTRTRTVELPELSGSVFARELKAAEVVEYSNRQKADPLSAIHYAVRAATVNAEGAAIFTADDDAVVAALPYKVIESLVDAILDLTGLKTVPTPAEKK